MAERRIEDIDQLGDADAKAAETAKSREELPTGQRRDAVRGKVATAKAEERHGLVEINYPEPTALSLIVKDVARWSEQCFVMEPSINVKLQIFAPRRLPPEKAYALFLTSLSVVGLRAVQVGQVIKIVPANVAVVA